MNTQAPSRIEPIEIQGEKPEPNPLEELALLEDNHPPSTQRPFVPSTQPATKVVETHAESRASKGNSRSNRASVREAIASIDKRFAAICKWCSSLQSCRTEAVWEELAPDKADTLLGIQNARHHGEWRLEFAQRSPAGPARQSEFRPLSEAPLDVKIRALALSERLLKDIVAQQRGVIREIRSALKHFDTTAASLGVKFKVKKSDQDHSAPSIPRPFSTVELA